MCDARLRRPKTANPATGGFDFNTELAARSTGLQPRRRPGSQQSQRAAAGGSSSPDLVPIRRVPSSLKRHIEIQTDPTQSQLGQYQLYGLSSGQGTEPPAPDASLFQPQPLPADTYRQQLQDEEEQLVLVPRSQLPGYASLPVLQPQQLQLLLTPHGRVLRRPATAAAVATYRSGRNGSCWRHVRQCTGNLGNNIMFIDGHVKEEDIRRFPPHGYPAMAGTAQAASGMPVPVLRRLAPKADGLGGAKGLYSTAALQRARTGAKYWVDDRQRQPMVPNTIQGRIMKSGVAY